MPKSGPEQARISIPYFEGVNSTVQHVIARKTELAHMENARAPIIGVLEKREGQQVIGHEDDSDDPFITLGNFGLVYFIDGGGDSQGLLRVSTVDGATSGIYYLNQDDGWEIVGNDLATNMALAVCDFANADGDLVIVNGSDNNRMLTGTIGASADMVDSTDPGSLFNSPIANKVAFYKSRIYLGDYYDGDGNRLRTSIIRSSYPLGIISLLNGDVTAVDVDDNWIIPITDNKYFYTSSGMNEYEIRRGNQLVATITITSYTESDLIAASADVTFEAGFTGFLAADEVWVAGTFENTKQYRWADSSDSIGRDVKQYDTFKLVGGDEDAITLMEPIGNILLIGNKNTLMTWNDYNLENFDLGIGSCSKNGAVKLKGSLYFLHYSGVYSTSGSMPQLLSRKVERYIKGASKEGLENAASGFKGLSVFFAIGDVNLYNNDGSFWKELPDVCLELNVADQNWYVHTNVPATEFETFIDDDGVERLAACTLTEARDAVYGPELITNGGFTGSADGWTLGDGWQYNDNDVIFVSS